GDSGYDSSYADTDPADPAGLARPGGQPGTGQPSGFGAAAQYQAQPGESAPAYSSGPQPAYNFQSPAGQSYGDSQPGSQAYGAQPGSGQPGAGFTFQSASGAPEASHGDETGPRPTARYADPAAYGQSGAQSFDAQSYESRQQESPSPTVDSYDQAYGGQGYGQQQAYQ